MKLLFTLLVYAFLILGFIAEKSARAIEIYVEPYAGYEMGDVEQGNSADDFSGENLGFRLGAQSAPFTYGFEYTLATLDVDKTGQDDELKAKDIGLFIGYEFSPVRLWFTMWMDNEADSDTGNGTYTGEAGYKMGLGFKVFEPISFNIEKTLRLYKEFEGNKLNQQVEVDGFLFSLSVPFSK